MIDILTVLETADEYTKYHSLVTKHNTDTDILRIVEWLGKYYKSTSALRVDWDSFETYFFTKNPMLNGAKKLLFEATFNSLKSYTATTMRDVLIDTMLQRYHAERIAFKAMEVAEGKTDDLLDVQAELDEYLQASGLAEAIGSEANRDDLSTLLSRVSHGKGLTWRMDALNQSLGPIRKGNFVLFGGRPDSGKTTLLCSEATYMATQLEDDERVVYFTNEEGGDVVKIRAICSLLGVDLATLETDPLTHWDNYVRILGIEDKILIVDRHNLHINDIDWWLKHEKAGLICIDQLRKVKGFDDVGGVQRQERLFQYARELSKEYAPTMTVTQLDGMAENVQYPDMSRLYESKTAVQGELDAIVNIGRVDGSIPANARFLNVVKNKLPTPNDPSLRNGKHSVILHADIARFA